MTLEHDTITKTYDPKDIKTMVVTPVRFAIRDMVSKRDGKQFQNVLIWTDTGDCFCAYKEVFEQTKLDVSKIQEGDQLEVKYVVNGTWKNYIGLKHIPQKIVRKPIDDLPF